MARIRVALKHAMRQGERALGHVIQVEDLKIDLARRLVFVGSEEVHLTPTEYKLLALLMRHAGKVLTHSQLLRGVWGPGHEHDAQYLRVYMAQLRRKLERDAAQPRYIPTESVVGYRIKLPAAAVAKASAVADRPQRR